MNVMTITQFKTLVDSGSPYQLIDVREYHETQICTLGGEHIPMGDLMENLDKLRTDIPVIFLCRSGKRSLAVLATLLAKTDLENITSLEGGILAWAEQIDSSMPTY